MPRRPALTLAALATSAAVALGGCSSDANSGSSGGDPSASSSSSSSASSSAASPSPSSTVAVPNNLDLTEQGTKLSFTQPATVIFESTQNKGTVLQLTVQSVQQGSIGDFKGFILDDAYKQKADYFYAKVQVKNVGKGDVGGVPVPLWGVNKANTLLPPVNFTTTFAPCPSKPLPAKFGPGRTLNTCLVYLSPDKGGLEAVSYRPSQEFNPITWTGTIKPPAATSTKKAKPKKKG